MKRKRCSLTSLYLCRTPHFGRGRGGFTFLQNRYFGMSEGQSNGDICWSQRELRRAGFGEDARGEIIRQFGGKDSNGGACGDIGPVVTVAAYAVEGGCSGNGIACHTNPRRLVAKLFVKQMCA